MMKILLALVLLQSTPPPPAFPQRTEQSLYAEIGQCTADVADWRKYAVLLTEEIAKRDKELAELKAKPAPKDDKKQSLPSKDDPK